MQISFADEYVTLVHAVKRLGADQAKARKDFGAEKTTEDIFVLKGSPAGRRNTVGFLPKRMKDADMNRMLPALAAYIGVLIGLPA
jgi:hypothetical protein